MLKPVKLLFCCLGLCAFSSLALANDIADLEQRLADAKGQLNYYNDEIPVAEAAVQGMEHEITGLEAEIEVLQKLQETSPSEDVKRELSSKNVKLRMANFQLKIKTKNLATSKNQLADQKATIQRLENQLDEARQAEQKRIAAEKEAARIAEEKRIAEERRLAEEKRRREEAERKRREEEARKRREEEERKRKAEEERKRQEELARQAEQERLAAEAAAAAAAQGAGGETVGDLPGTEEEPLDLPVPVVGSDDEPAAVGDEESSQEGSGPAAADLDEEPGEPAAETIETPPGAETPAGQESTATATDVRTFTAAKDRTGLNANVHQGVMQFLESLNGILTDPNPTGKELAEVPRLSGIKIYKREGLEFTYLANGQYYLITSLVEGRSTYKVMGKSWKLGVKRRDHKQSHIFFLDARDPAAPKLMMFPKRYLE